MPESKGRRGDSSSSKGRHRAARKRRGSGSTPSGSDRGGERSREGGWHPRIRSKTWRRMRRWGFLGAAGLIAFLVILSFALSGFPGSTPTQSSSESRAGEGAQVGDHIHASVRVEICGDEIDLPPSSGSVHSHGDGQAHIHPQNSGEAGSNATLGRFFDSFPMVLGSGRIQAPRGELYEDGKPCADGEPGTVRVEINGKDSTETFRSHVFRGNDRVKVSFE